MVDGATGENMGLALHHVEMELKLEVEIAMIQPLCMVVLVVQVQQKKQYCAIKHYAQVRFQTFTFISVIIREVI